MCLIFNHVPTKKQTNNFFSYDPLYAVERIKKEHLYRFTNENDCLNIYFIKIDYPTFNLINIGTTHPYHID